MTDGLARIAIFYRLELGCCGVLALVPIHFLVPDASVALNEMSP